MKWLVIAVLALAGCRTKAQINTARLDELKTRAAFDLKCSAGDLVVTDLTNYQEANPYMRMAGVEGCGQRATYIWATERKVWFMDAAGVGSETAGPPANADTPAAEQQKEAQP